MKDIAEKTGAAQLQKARAPSLRISFLVSRGGLAGKGPFRGLEGFQQAEAKLRLRGRGSKFLEGPEQKARHDTPSLAGGELDVLAGVFGPFDALRQRARPRLLRGS